MSQDRFEDRRPFGEVSFEREQRLLGVNWHEYYFKHAPFNDDALDVETYLIVGRRGCGKSSLAEFFKYQDALRHARCVHIDKPDFYDGNMRHVVENLGQDSEAAINTLVDVWSYLIWSGVFKATSLYEDRKDHIPQQRISEAFTSRLIGALLKGLMDKFLAGNGNRLEEIIRDQIRASGFDAKKQKALSITHRRPLIIAIDSHEHYPIDDHIAMWKLAALVQAASEISFEYARRGVHVKVFIPDEIFPHIKEGQVTNTSKFIIDPLYLYWRPKDLLRLVCWRFFKYLKSRDLIALKEDEIDWDDYTEVNERLWVPYFGKTLTNRNGITEDTFAYVMRHTQLRPRQLIILCNRIARRAIRRETFPVFGAETIRSAVREVEIDLADEVINSYSRIYPNIGNILSALAGLPMQFNGKLLDAVAKRSSSEWSNGGYSLHRFREVVSEMGVVGRTRGEKDDRTGILEADFSFAMADRLFITEQDRCVIHPMFYNKFNTQPLENTCIYPFPDHPSFDIVRKRS